MKKSFIRYMAMVLLCVLTANTALQAQVSVLTHQNQTAQSLIENYFLGSGVTVSNVRYNGNLNIGSSNQVGSFTNPDISGNNIKLQNGIIMMTGNISGGTQGPAGNAGTGANNCTNCYNEVNATPLFYLMQDLNPGYNLNDIACLSFDFTTTGEQVSFKYVFASDEYHSYVCSSYNDAFGFFISGPYEEDGVTAVNLPGITFYQNKNIAIVPGTESQIVTINTVNGNPDNLTSSTSTCDISHTDLFINNFPPSTLNKFNGYTKAFETKKLTVAPCYKYNICMAVCNTSDHALNSGVYLGANSFRSDNYKLTAMYNLDTIFHPGDTVAVNDTINKAPCDSITVTIKLNRPAEENESYTLRVKGDMTAGVDYVDFGNQLEFAQGDSIVKMVIHFLDNPADTCGQIKHLQILSEDLNECTPVDTINICAKVPCPLIFDNVSTNKVYCADVLPIREHLIAHAKNEIGNLTYSWKNAEGEPVGDYPNSDTNSIVITEPMTVTITATDECFREINTTINFSIKSATTKVSVDKNKICYGDSVKLSSTQAETYQWTSKPVDARLSLNATVQNPIAAPTSQTTYFVTTVDSNGCVSSDSVSVLSLPKVIAKMSLSPTKLYYSSTNTKYEDKSSDVSAREWDFGDGIILDKTVNSQSGLHSYPMITKDYDVMLVVYNEAACSDTAYGKISVKPDFTIWIPNAFTPGNTTGNSTFGPSSSIELQYNMKIFNRWGKAIFVTDNSKPWDGKLDNGKFAPNGAYTYIIDYIDGEGLHQQKSGVVNLINAGN